MWQSPMNVGARVGWGSSPLAKVEAGSIFEEGVALWGIKDGNMGALKTEVSGSCDGNGNAAFQPATHLGIRAFPFFGKKRGHAFHEHVGLSTI